MAKKPNQTRRPAPQEPELNTVRALRRIVIRMQTGGLVFLIVGLTMPRFSPFFAEKQWNTLFGLKLGLPQALVAFGCIMLMVSIFAFLRSYRCPKCKGLLGLTPYTAPRACRHCGAKIKDTDILRKE